MTQRYLCFKAFFYFVISIDILPSERYITFILPSGIGVHITTEANSSSLVLLPSQALLLLCLYSLTSLLPDHSPPPSCMYAHIHSANISEHLQGETIVKGQGAGSVPAHLNMNPSSALKVRNNINTSIESGCENVNDLSPVKHFRQCLTCSKN